MQWKLAHFGLELNPPEDIIKLSSVWIRDVLPFKAVGQPEQNLRGTVLDPILNGPPLEETLLNTIGHIKLAVPVARPECMDQIVEQINKSRPLKFPLQKFGKSKSAQFHYDLGAYNDKASEEELVVNPNDIHDAFNPKFGGSNRPIVIHGDQFTEHNVEAEPRLMFLTVLPVPSIVARPNDGDSLHPLTKKLNTIVRMNSFIENALIDENVPEMILKDMVSLLTYHVLTYLDNAIPGIPSDDELQAGIAQMLGSDVDVISEAPTEADIAGTTLHRIVRGINMGEAVILVNQNTDDAQSLSFELTKQVAFNRVWKKSGRDTQVVHINSYGEIYRMDIGTIENYDWTLWDGSQKIRREVVVAPRGSPRLIDAPMSGQLNRVVQQLQLIDEDFRLDLKQQLALNYLYSICEIGQELQEQLIVICDVDMDPIVLRPLIRRLETQNKTGLPICLILTEMHLDGVVSYKYEPTEDPYRNLIIAFTSLKERREFEQKSLMFDNIRPTHLKLIATYVKGLTRKEVTQLLGESILAKGNINPDHLREYIKAYLQKRKKSTDHLKPNPLKPKRKLTIERLYSNPNEVYMGLEEASDSMSDESEENHSADQTDENDSLYASLKGLEPLVNWAQLKGKMFTPAAKEFGFVGYPKGLLLTGVPGCGKTMAAKIIAEEWDMKLHRINPDDITSKFVGGSEENMRSVLDKLVEDAPSICFVDEAEKLFVQMNSDIQSAATMGVDSTESILLQFMEENEEPVFFIFTANDLQKMSPAIIDRFEGRFFVDLPDQIAREEIVSLMLRERKKGHLDLDSLTLAKASVGFTGRDIRGAIDEAMMEAFGQDRELHQEDLEAAFAKVKPTSVVHANRIETMRALVAQGKIRSANSPRVVINNASEVGFDVSFG